MSKNKSGWNKKVFDNESKDQSAGDGEKTIPWTENSVVLKCFKKYATYLDEMNDKFERIVKLGRDLTIESKRIIFLLHKSDRVDTKSKVLDEAEKRLNTLVKENILQIGKELKDEDPYMFHKAYTSGVQEFIEAFTFYHYLRDKKLYHWDLYQDLVRYKVPKISEPSTESETEDPESEDTTEIITTLMPPDYILGVADLTGELMRRCINNLGYGDLEGCYETCDIVRKLYKGFLCLDTRSYKSISPKKFTLKQSLLKMENVCYNINVRCKEVPQHMLADIDPEFDYPDKDDCLN